MDFNALRSGGSSFGDDLFYDSDSDGLSDDNEYYEFKVCQICSSSNDFFHLHHSRKN